MTVEEATDVLKKDIKCYTDNPCGEPCEPGGCPYFIDDNDMVEAEQIAIEALEKQIPKKPIDLANSTYSKCPTCGNFHFDNYCANCGQKIDWSTNESV